MALCSPGGQELGQPSWAMRWELHVEVAEEEGKRSLGS